MGVPDRIQTWQMVKAGNPKTGEPGVLEQAELPVPPLAPGDALVQVAGCGVCRTDLSYFYEGVPTVTKPPLTLGHEISGTVVAGPADWLGREVIVPAVMPCHACPICAAGRGNRCLSQKMPGSSLGVYGGFSSHIAVPGRDLCAVGERHLPLSHLAVVADAVTTPYQAAMRAQIAPGDRVVVVGCGGGVGTYMTQIAKALGAGFVVGIDVDEATLQRALRFGADAGVSSSGKGPKDVQESFRAVCQDAGLPHNWGWKIFEVSGTKAGQGIALRLLSFVGKLIVVGYTMATTELMISRLMAYDAEMIGTWGCLPRYYPDVLQLVRDGKIQVEPFVETRPLSSIRETFEDVRARKVERRVVLEPDF